MVRQIVVALISLLLIPRTGSAQGVLCPGDCDGSGDVTVNELVQAVNIALANVPPQSCPAADIGGDGEVTIDELLSAVNALLYACPVSAATPTPTATATEVPPTATATPTVALDPQNPATSSAPALKAWLEAGLYKSWHAESAAHPSGGPHGGKVRTFLNDAVFDSLSAGAATHPRGAAVVKELYFNGDTVQQWAVEVKLDDDSRGGANWYWYEGVGLAGKGVAICTSCHGNNYRSYVTKDFVLTPFPLQ